MPRRKRALRKSEPVDPKYKDAKIGALIAKVMLDGKKMLATRIVLGAIEDASAKLKVDSLEMYNQALDNITPMVEVKSRRIGGGNYQIPTEIKPERRLALALRWLITSARARKGKPMQEKLALELIDAYQNSGSVVKKREDTHKMAEANKALAHFSKY